MKSEKLNQLKELMAKKRLTKTLRIRYSLEMQDSRRKKRNSLCEEVKVVHAWLEAITKAYIKEICSIYPIYAVDYGFSEFYPILSYPTEEQETRLRNFLDSSLAELSSINEELNEMEKIDKEVLEYIFREMSFMLEIHPYNEKNVIPSSLILKGVHDILQVKHLSTEKKLEYILSRLNHSLSWFDDLRSTWKHATILNLEDAIPQLQNLEVSLSSMIHSFFKNSSQLQSEIENKILSIGEKGKTFAEWLEYKVKPITTVIYKPIGQMKYQQLLEIRSEGHSWFERLKMGEESLKNSKQRLQVLAEKLVSEKKGVKAAMAKVREDQPTGSILEEAKRNHEYIMNFMKEKELLDVPPASIDIMESPSWDPFWGEGMAGIQAKEILTDSPLFQLIIAPPTSAKGKGELNRSAIMLIIAHEGAAGHMSSYILTKQRNNLIRQLVNPRSGIDDRWTFYWEEVLNHAGIKPDIKYDFLVEYRKFWCALRTICDVKLHCELMSFDECANFLETAGDVPSIMAKVYAKAILLVPGYFSSFIIGKKRLFTLRDHVRKSLGSNFSLKRFHQWIGEAGPIPHHLLEKEIDLRIKNVITR